MTQLNDEQTTDNKINKGESVTKNLNSDLPDSPRDEERLKNEETIINLPDVRDIPGQEHVHVAPLGELADTTISSDDEEADNLFDDDDDAEIMGTEADVTTEEQNVLAKAGEDMPADDDTTLRASAFDDTDNEGEPLNEGSLGTDVSGSDLDTSGIDSDDEMESVGEEDEENNMYSLGSESNDDVTEGTP